MKDAVVPVTGFTEHMNPHERRMPCMATQPISVLVRAGVYVSLFPLALLDSMGASILGALLLLLAWVIKPRFNIFDLLLLSLFLTAAYAWLSAGELSKGFIGSQIGPYIVFICSLRFFHAGRQSIERLLLSLPIISYVVLCLVYLGVQIQVGYVYEIGVLETFMLVYIAANTPRRNIMLVLLVAYLVAMCLISTRSTPLIAALLILSVWMIRMPRQLLNYFYIFLVVITPFLGFMLMGLTLSSSVLDMEDNLEIRLEMIKGASSQMGLDEILFGVGFGTPFRDASYAYAFRHPLLNDFFLVNKVSNHNSLFDVFLRFGIFGYLLFCVLIMKAFALNRALSRYSYLLLFIVLYSLSFNAYLDSTRLVHSCAAMIGGIYILLKPKHLRARYSGSRKAAFCTDRDALE